METISIEATAKRESSIVSAFPEVWLNEAITVFEGLCARLGPKRLGMELKKRLTAA